MRFPKRRCYLLCVVLLLAFASLYAQQNSEITGIVADPTGNVVPGATVKLTETSTGYSRVATTDSAGLFTFPNLNIGTYSLDVTAKGFQTYHASGIVLNVSRTLRQDVQLKVGAAAETVTVQADALTPSGWAATTPIGRMPAGGLGISKPQSSGSIPRCFPPPYRRGPAVPTTASATRGRTSPSDRAASTSTPRSTKRSRFTRT